MAANESGQTVKRLSDHHREWEAWAEGSTRAACTRRRRKNWPLKLRREISSKAAAGFEHDRN